MKVSDYVIEYLAKLGIRHNFEMIGGAIAHLIDSTVDRDDIVNVSMHHEQSAAFAAEAYARITGNLGLAMATSGPGALNLLTGIGSCYFDSTSCLFITGQVNTYEYKHDRPVRQIGFQETDIVTVAQSLTKYAVMVTEADQIKYHLDKAVFFAKSGRPGPVLLDIPMNIQRQEINPDTLIGFSGDSEDLGVQVKNDSVLDVIMDKLLNAQRPIILVGGGIRIGNASEELSQIVNTLGIPVVSSLMGLDAVEHNEYHYGLIGAYGNRYSNLALANSDLILILGSRLDSRQTGTRPDTFGRQAYKIHVDIDENELNQKVQVDLVVNQNVKTFLNSLLNRVEQAQMKLDVSDWKRTLDQYRDLFPAHNFIENQEGIDPNHFIEKLSEASPENTILVLDVGQHQMWASQSFRIKKGQRILNSGGMGAMGFALPAAIGAAFANPDAMVIVVCGDGGLQVNIQELETIVFHQVNIKVIVMNNKSLGMVRAFQDIYFDGRQQSTTKGYSAPDFCKIANAYDCEASAIKNAKEIESAVSKLSEKDGPYLLEVRLEQDTVVNPKLIVNKPIEDMHPEVSREELRKLMIIDLVEE